MFGKKEKNSPQIDNAVAKSINYEVSIADIARRSEKRAWMVAFASILMSLILAGGYFYMLPLKEIQPFMVMADAYTGTATVATLRGDFNTNAITTSEAFNKSNVAHYILARETFDTTSWAKDWKRVHAMSTSDVGSSYTLSLDRNDPKSPVNLYGSSLALRVEILSIQLSQSGSAQKPIRSATVRFQRNTYDKKSGKSSLLDNKIATLQYAYNPNLAMDDKDRIDNPIGFQVTEYRVDNDYSGSTPVATPATAQTLGQQPGATPYPQPYPPVPGYPQPVPGQVVPTIPGQPIPGQPAGTVVPAPGYPAQVPAAGQAPVVGSPVPPQNPVDPTTGVPASQPPAPSGQAPNQVNGVGN